MSGSVPGHAAIAAPSPWVTRWLPLVPAGGRVLDVACGGGRHALLAARQGHEVLAIDRDAAALQALSGKAKRLQVLQADLELGAWPLLPTVRFDAVIVTNYLYRPLWPHLLAAVGEGGVLIYETFAAGNETVGRPANPDFLLRPGELLEVARQGLRTVAYEDGFISSPKPAFVQRLCAVREAAGTAAVRYPLDMP